MLGIGFWEMLIIAGLILIAVGPDRLPSMVKTVAKFYRQFRRTAEDLRASTGIDELLRDEELKELAELRKQKLALQKRRNCNEVAEATQHRKPQALASKCTPCPTRWCSTTEEKSRRFGASRSLTISLRGALLSQTHRSAFFR